MPSGDHIRILDPMRGIAALAVVLFHYSDSILPTLIKNPLSRPLSFGFLGVQVFFVISGFVMPYALQRSGYQLRDLGRFMLRRFVRIAPPAYAAALLMVLYYYLSVLVLGHPVEGNEIPALGFRSIVANLTFAVPYLHTNWFNFVYWTLTVEFEFYFVIALIFPMIAGQPPRIRLAAVLFLFVLLPFIGGSGFVHYSIYFLMGTLVFRWKHVTADRPLLITVFILACTVGYMNDGFAPMAVAVAAASVIMIAPRVLFPGATWIGKVSYSLYIVHVPVGYFAEALFKLLGGPALDPWGKVGMLLIYTAAAMLAAELFHRFVEKPFLDRAKRIRQGRTARDAPAFEIS